MTAGILDELRFAIGIIRTAPDERALGAFPFLRFRRLRGRGKRCVEVVPGFDLLFQFSGGRPPRAVLEGIRKQKRRAVA